MFFLCAIFGGLQLLLVLRRKTKHRRPREIWIKNGAKRSNNNTAEFSTWIHTRDGATREMMQHVTLLLSQDGKERKEPNSQTKPHGKCRKNMIFYFFSGFFSYFFSGWGSGKERRRRRGKLSRKEVLFLALFKIIKMNFNRGEMESE